MRKLGIAAALLVLLTACGKTAAVREGEGSTKSGMQLRSPKSGATVEGNVVVLDVTPPKGIEIVKPNGDTSGKTGHWHVFIDREPPAAGATMPREPGIVHSAATPIRLTGLSIGEHKITVVVGNGSHQRIGSDAVHTVVDVGGPSVDASAPAALAKGATLTIQVKVEGATLAPANGDTTRKTGHLHVLVDRQVEVGKPVPKEAGIIHSAKPTIEVPGLAPGEHKIQVVLGDGTHVPFDPPVMDELTVTVA